MKTLEKKKTRVNGPAVQIDNSDDEGGDQDPLDGEKHKSVVYAEKDIIKTSMYTKDDQSLRIDVGANDDGMQYKTQGSVMIKKQAQNIWNSLANDHIDKQILIKKETETADALDDLDEGQPDQMFIAQKIKLIFKRSNEDDGITDKLLKIIEVPLNFLRDFTIPMSDINEWDRNRAAIVPITIPWAFCYMQGMLTTGDDSVDNEEGGAEQAEEAEDA